ncbi:MAG: hypothetical protein PVG96_03165, partial [Desulfobacterales bacterium]
MEQQLLLDWLRKDRGMGSSTVIKNVILNFIRGAHHEISIKSTRTHHRRNDFTVNGLHQHYQQTHGAKERQMTIGKALFLEAPP